MVWSSASPTLSRWRWAATTKRSCSSLSCQRCVTHPSWACPGSSDMTQEYLGGRAGSLPSSLYHSLLHHHHYRKSRHCTIPSDGLWIQWSPGCLQQGPNHMSPSSSPLWLCHWPPHWCFTALEPDLPSFHPWDPDHRTIHRGISQAGVYLSFHLPRMGGFLPRGEEGQSPSPVHQLLGSQWRTPSGPLCYRAAARHMLLHRAESAQRLQPCVDLGRRWVEDTVQHHSGPLWVPGDTYSLTNAPSVFQSFLNDVLRDMLGRFVIDYINDILIYSPSLPACLPRSLGTCPPSPPPAVHQGWEVGLPPDHCLLSAVCQLLPPVHLGFQLHWGAPLSSPEVETWKALQEKRCPVRLRGPEVLVPYGPHLEAPRPNEALHGWGGCFQCRVGAVLS